MRPEHGSISKRSNAPGQGISQKHVKSSGRPRHLRLLLCWHPPPLQSDWPHAANKLRRAHLHAHQLRRRGAPPALRARSPLQGPASGPSASSSPPVSALAQSPPAPALYYSRLAQPPLKTTQQPKTAQYSSPRFPTIALPRMLTSSSTPERWRAPLFAPRVQSFAPVHRCCYRWHDQSTRWPDGSRTGRCALCAWCRQPRQAR
mmetsp:Transcript_28846/g.70805  ORF Transcript_28846/g.70805 Transcript_28846/m.70805 type:complete len:203 (-) Transcript_28846:1062-1670(-)